MKKLVKPCLVALLYLIVGLVLLISVEALKLPGHATGSYLILAAFIGLNIIFSHVFKLKQELYKFWSLKKLWLFPIATVAGIAIALFPLVSGLIILKVIPSEITLVKEFSISAIAITFIIISWEELWFRGLFVNYCNRSISTTALSLIIGFLFVLLHVLNPEINLVRSGPALFFAGSLLTITYLHFQSLWFPVGLHFGNNYAGSLFSSKLNNDLWFGNDGYLSALLLAGLFLIFAKLQQRKN